MKLALSTGEGYPMLYVTFPGDADHEWEVKHYGTEVPDELAERYRKAREAFNAVERELWDIYNAKEGRSSE